MIICTGCFDLKFHSYGSCNIKTRRKNQLLEFFLIITHYITDSQNKRCSSLHSTTRIREVLWSSSNPYCRVILHNLN
jgi:hypothetical protein